MSDKATRFYLLDGIRGIAAIAVMLFHFTEHNGLRWLGGAWAAVDLFFVLSGLVIAHSYGHKIAAGMTFRQFILTRLIRLAPLYIAGLVLGFTATWVANASGGASNISARQLGNALSLGLLGLPYLNDGKWPFGTHAIFGAIFPLNIPSWSLFFELFANIVYFYALTMLRRSADKYLVLGAMAVYIASFAVYHQVNPGWAEWNYAFAFPRATGEFLIGVWIYTAHWHARRPSVWLLVPTGGLSLLLFATGNSTITFVNSITLVPLTIALASSARVPPLGRGLCKWLGDMSYPIYVLHYPLYALAFGLLPIDQLQPVVQVVCITLAVVPIAYAGNALDMRVRRWLGEKMTPLAVARPPAL